MKFVHLAPQPLIGRIRKNGIRFGDGRRGRGVYSVPLLKTPRLSCVGFGDEINYRYIESDLRSSMTLWKWLRDPLRRKGRRNIAHQNLAAVIFEATKACWPADIYLFFCDEQDSEIPDRFSRLLQLEGHLLESKRLSCVGELPMSPKKDPHDDYWVHVPSPQCHFVAQDDLAIGGLMQCLLASGHRFHGPNRGEDSVEVVFRTPIKSDQVESIIPLYRSNKQFKSSRRRRG